MTDIGKLQRLPLREVWRHEAHNFTRWLTDNIDVLNEVLPTELINPKSEQAAGSFSVDILAEDEDSNFVIIENQLEKSDHDHLGKLITYLTAFDAKRAVWIRCTEPGPEHIQSDPRGLTGHARRPLKFHLFKVEAIRIDDSPHRGCRHLPVSSACAKNLARWENSNAILSRRKSNDTNSGVPCCMSALIDKTELHARISPSHKTWIGTSKAGFQYNYVVWQHSTRVELYIDRGKGAEEKNEL
ncbi:MAG: hypothetical protein U5L04_02080 [Trueperaceae bacterium]|nr:hypothetical protein [Trueperaceae bacterium]